MAHCTKWTAFTVAGLALAHAGCGSSTTEQPLLPIRETAGTAAITMSKKPVAQPKWSGIQSCSGYKDNKSIDKTTTETHITSFMRSKTGVSLTGVTVGPSPEYTCENMMFDGVITDSSGSTLFFFESASSQAEKQQRCKSKTGQALIVGWLNGSDTDLRSLGSDWSVKFELRIEEPAAPDAGVSISRLTVTCKFELQLE
jgi:hypothetical protein